MSGADFVATVGVRREFALVAPVFFALLFAIIETAIMFFASQALETMTQESARLVLTGQAQTASLTQAQFQNYVCSQIPVAGLFACGNIYVDVKSYPSSTGTSAPRSPMWSSTARSTATAISSTACSTIPEAPAISLS
jgi:Flp pilus assembly protein TadG